MDVTAFSVVAFTAAKTILRLVLILMMISLVRKVQLGNSAATDASTEDRVPAGAPSLGTLLWSYRIRIAGLVVILVMTLMVSQIELAYRPKTVIGTKNPVLEEQLRAIDKAEKPDITPALGDQRDNANADYGDRNRSENKSARDSFMQLPNSD